MTPDHIAATAAKILLDTKCVLFNNDEPFVFTSGRISPVYTDIRRLIGFPKERDTLMDFAAEMLKPLNLDMVAGGETVESLAVMIEADHTSDGAASWRRVREHRTGGSCPTRGERATSASRVEAPAATPSRARDDARDDWKQAGA